MKTVYVRVSLTVQCDHPGCLASWSQSQDGGPKLLDASSVGSLEDQAEGSGWTITTSEPEQHLCPRHKPQVTP